MLFIVTRNAVKIKTDEKNMASMHQCPWGKVEDYKRSFH